MCVYFILVNLKIHRWHLRLQCKSDAVTECQKGVSRIRCQFFLVWGMVVHGNGWPTFPATSEVDSAWKFPTLAVGLLWQPKARAWTHPHVVWVTESLKKHSTHGFFPPPFKLLPFVHNLEIGYFYGDSLNSDSLYLNHKLVISDHQSSCLASSV